MIEIAACPGCVLNGMTECPEHGAATVAAALDYFRRPFDPDAETQYWLTPAFDGDDGSRSPYDFASWLAAEREVDSYPLPAGLKGYRIEWQDIKSRDQAQIAEWAQEKPDANVMGVPDGLTFVIDADRPDVLEEALLTAGLDPEAELTTFASYSGGATLEQPKSHYYFRAPDLASVPDGVFYTFGEVRSKGRGGVILPGSLHPDGPRYRLRTWGPLATATPELLAVIAASPDLTKRQAGAKPRIEHPPGNGLSEEDRDILEAIGADPERGKGVVICPAHDDHNPSLSWRVDTGKLLLHCFAGCDFREVRAAIIPDTGISFTLGRSAPAAEPARVSLYPEPEDRGRAVRTDPDKTEYVDDLIRPGRIVVWAAEEGAGKSYAVAGELAIRVAAAEGMFAGTWQVNGTGPVLVLSEMHSDDDYEREETVLTSLELSRPDLEGRYFRLSVWTAVEGKPSLTVDDWRRSRTAWMRDHRIRLLIVDTVTAAMQITPWGAEILEAYGWLRQMIADYPALAVVLVVHMKKPQGRGQRVISDVMGEWGRFNDVTVIQENDGSSLTRARLTVRKRVKRETRIVVTKAGGLLVDPQDITESSGGGPKVAPDVVLAAITANPGLSYAELAKTIGVSKNSAAKYATALADRVSITASGPKRSMQVFPTAQPLNTDQQA